MEWPGWLNTEWEADYVFKTSVIPDGVFEQTADIYMTFGFPNVFFCHMFLKFLTYNKPD